jgi:DNA-binding beta-propeller fold protein YncE
VTLPLALRPRDRRPLDVRAPSGRLPAVAIALLACAPVRAGSAVVDFTAPAGALPTGHLRGATYDAVLPSGRIVTPVGTSVVTGTNALGVALSPDGRFAVVVDAGGPSTHARSALEARVVDGDALTVVEVASMRVVDRFALPGEGYFAGIVAVRDPRFPVRTLVFVAGGASGAVDVVDLDANGHLTPDVRHVIPLTDCAVPGADPGRRVPTSLVAAADGRRIYAIDSGAQAVCTIDTTARSSDGTIKPVGFFPFGAALAGDRLLVANEGLMRYVPSGEPALVPPFFSPPPDARNASALSFVSLRPDAAGASPALALDEAPDGRRIIGGAHPTSIAVTADGAYAFVAMTGVDRIATVALGTSPHVVGGTELRLFDRGPYGTQPAALALSRDGTRVYAALAGMDAVAVLDARDPLHVHRLGLLPTGWYPTALTLSADDRSLLVVNTKGFGYEPGAAGSPGAVWSTLQKIDLGGVALAQSTATTLKNTRDVRPAPPSYPLALQHVVVVEAGSAAFGDGAGGAAPNVRALAQRFASAADFSADSDDAQSAQQVLAGGIATLFAQRSAVLEPRSPASAAVETPDSYPRAGYLVNALARHAIGFRDYGDLVRLAGCDDGGDPNPLVDDPQFAGFDDLVAPTRGLGGRYAIRVPAPAALAGHIDLDYPGWNPRIRDERRAREFVRDFDRLVRAHRQPRYAQLWLPGAWSDPRLAVSAGAEAAADEDRAIGAIVQYLSHLESWKNSAILIVSDGRPAEHGERSARGGLIVVSPFAKRGYVGVRHLSSAGVLKTAEQVLALPPLALGDLLATDLSDFFTPEADPRPYAALGPGARPAREPEPVPARRTRAAMHLPRFPRLGEWDS